MTRTTAVPRPWRRRAIGVLAGATMVFATAGCGGQASSSAAQDSDRRVDQITVAAASDLRPAFEQLGKVFEAETGTSVTFSFGSSGQLREQIVNGAPFHLFASANVSFVDEVIESGRGVAATKAAYALGRIVLWAPPGVALPKSIDDLTDARYRRIAIANPDHAPYGLAAKQALKSAGVHDLIESRLVYGENISDTFRIAQSRNADIGIIALSLAIADGSHHTLLPAELHEPLEQALVVTSRGRSGHAAGAFATFLGSPAGRAVMVRYGFVLPGEPAPKS